MADAREYNETILDLKDSARRRVICGLRWDPMETSRVVSRQAAERGGRTDAYDLDLICVMFDRNGRMIGGVTGEEGHRIADFGNIYHTGDVIDGEDMLDDEQISLELFNLSANIEQIFFIAEVQSAHTFGDISNPEIRLANAADDLNFVHTRLTRENESKETAYIFGYLKRNPQGWSFFHIGHYYEGHEISDWNTALSPYLVISDTGEGEEKAPPAPLKGQTVPLFYSRQARQRVICGLNWDPLEGQEGQPYDLDLACVMYNKDGEAVDGVSAESNENIDASGKVYHSGDDTSGEGSRTDDEAISVELKDLPDYIHHIVFIAEIQSAHSFGDIQNPSMRIADGKTNADQLFSPLSCPESRDRTAYVFARLNRSETGWNLTFIDHYASSHEIDDWVEYLQRYLG